MVVVVMMMVFVFLWMTFKTYATSGVAVVVCVANERDLIF